MPLDLGYSSSEQDDPRSGSSIRPLQTVSASERSAISVLGGAERGKSEHAGIQSRKPSNSSLVSESKALQPIAIKGMSRPSEGDGSSGGMQIANVYSQKRLEVDLTVSIEDAAPRNGDPHLSNTSERGRESSRGSIKERLPGSSPSEEGALVNTPQPIHRNGLEPSSSLERGKDGADHVSIQPSTKRDRRRSREEPWQSPARLDRDRSPPRKESKKRSQRSDDESDSYARPSKERKAFVRSPPRETSNRETGSRTVISSRAYTENTADRPEQRSSRRLPEDDRERELHRSSRTRRNDDALDYDFDEGGSHGNQSYDRYSRDSRRGRADYDDYRGSGRDRYDNYDYRDDRDSRYRHDRYRPDERSSHRRRDYDDHYRAGSRRDYGDVRDASFREDDHAYRSRDMRDDRDMDYNRTRGIAREGDRRPKSPLPGPVVEPRARSPIAWTHAPQREHVAKPNRTPTELEPPAPPPSLPHVPPPPPSPPLLKRKSPPPDFAEDEQTRANKRPKLSRQETSVFAARQPSIEPLQEIPPPPKGAATPDPQLVEPPVEPPVPTPVPERPIRSKDRDEELRQERKLKRDLFPDRSRIGLGQGKRLDFDRESKTYGKAFVGLGRLEGYKVSKTNDGALGRGTFGTVTKATRISDGTLVALKLLQNPQQTQQKSGSPRKDGMLTTTAREIKNLKMLNHENIVPLLEMIVERKAGESEANIFLVFPYMEHDLCGYIHSTESTLTVQNLKVFAAQMLDGLAEMHRNKIVHRDLKTANILINNRGLLQIADFGLSRALSSDRPSFTSDDAHYTNMVVTRWYRAPELLVGETMYGPAVDMWSIGCILAEMFTGKVFIMGKSNSHQLLRIFHLIGPPRNGTWERFDAILQYNDVQEDDPSFARKSIKVQEIMATAVDSYHGLHNTDASSWNPFRAERELEALIRSLLELNPAKRPTALDARSNQFFQSSLGYSRDMIAPLKQDSRESGSMARNAMSKQMRDDISVDPFHFPGAVPAPVYSNMGQNAASYQAMANTMQSANVAANMFAANPTAMMQGGGMGNPPMMARQNLLNISGMASAPIAQLPGGNRFNSNVSNHSTPNRAPQMSFNPSRGPPQPGPGNGLPYSNMGPQGQYHQGPPGRPGGPSGYGQPSFVPNNPRPSFAAPVRQLPNSGMLPSRPGLTNGAMHQAPTAAMPGQRPR